MVFSDKKRFIAGATCPQCKSQDTIAVFHEAGKDWRLCVQCEFKEVMSSEETSEHPTDAQPVRVIDPSN